jgi:serine/threonine-protein kinase
MATVYLAEDLKHHRQVAVKVLRPELASALGPERFHREIKIAARLTHPHILPLHDSGESNGFLYYVMPYVEGESLADRLSREKQLPVDDALRLAREVSAGLDYAHRHDVVHRDIKPENIMLHDGSAMVTDFGIGKAVSAAGGDEITQTGVTIGTPAYMSPEQAASEPEIDGRSDLYSLGCVLYEMLAGEPLFTGPTPQAIIAKRFTQTPPDLCTTRETIPPGIAQAVKKLLAKAPADRFATGAQVAEALVVSKATLQATPEAAEKSIAVLPFANMSADPENEYFADGITEEIINALTQFEDLRVVARTSAFAFKGKHEDLRVVGEKLNVSKVLEGSVRKAGNRLRITAQLVNVADGYHLWSEKYDREMDDVFAVQDEIASAIADRLKVALADKVDEALVKPATENLEAYQLYWKGRHFWNQRGPGLKQGLECFEQALALDPEYALAHAGVADSHLLLGFYGMVPSREAMPKAKGAAKRALELDPTLAEPHTTLGFVTFSYDWDWPAAELEFERALELNPRYVAANYWRGAYRAVVGRLIGTSSSEDAIADCERAAALDPLAFHPIVILAWCYIFVGRYAEALPHLHRVVELQPALLLGHLLLGTVYRGQSKYAEAITAAQSATQISSRHPWAVVDLGLTYAAAGRMADAKTIYDELVQRARSEYVQGSVLAPLAAALGKTDEAFALLEESYEERDARLIFLGVYPDYDPLRKDPRFPDLMMRMGLGKRG